MNEEELKSKMSKYLLVARGFIEIHSQPVLPTAFLYTKGMGQESGGLSVIGLEGFGENKVKAIELLKMRCSSDDIEAILFIMEASSYNIKPEQLKAYERGDIDESTLDRKSVIHMIGETDGGIRLIATTKILSDRKVGETSWLNFDATHSAGLISNFFEKRRNTKFDVDSYG